MARPVTLYTLQWGDYHWKQFVKKRKNSDTTVWNWDFPIMWMSDVRIRLIIKESRIC